MSQANQKHRRQTPRQDRQRITIGGVLLVVAGLVAMAILDPVKPPTSEPATRPKPTSPPSASWSGRCVGVSDGDTISVMHDGVEVRIRLNGIDCPEKDQAFASVARKFTSDAVLGRDITVSPTDEDQYGRTVADVMMPDGHSLNEALVAAGMAWWYRYHAPDDARLEALETEARRARVGLWADANPTPPWDFRRANRH